MCRDGLSELSKAVTSGFELGIEVFRSTGDSAAFLASCYAIAAAYGGQGDGVVVDSGHAEQFDRLFSRGIKNGVSEFAGQIGGFVRATSDKCESSDNFRSGRVDTCTGDAEIVEQGGGGSSVTVVSDNVDVSGREQLTNVVPGRGPNWARNVKNRAEQKARKLRRKSLGVDWRRRDGGDMVKQDDTPGNFWNSTSKEVRQQLIDSKAKMHIAENERREREARDKLAYYDSPESAMHKAVAMIEFAQKQAKKDKDSRVYGWAHTVASASAESLARSTPDSVPSFDELSAKLEASSQSSFELEIKAKQDELDAKDVKIKQLEAEARIQKNLAEMRGKQSAEKVEQEKHAAVVKRMNELEAELKRSSKHLPDWYKNMDRDRAKNRAMGLC